MKKPLIYLSLASLFFTTSCASIIASKKQKVNISTNDQEAEVYIEDSLVASGDYKEFKLTKQYQSYQFIVKKEGYLPAYYSSFMSKRSPLYIISWLPPFILYFAPAFEGGRKSFRYDLSEKKFEPSTIEKTDKKEDEKYIIVNNVAFNVEKDSLEQFSMPITKYKNAGYTIDENRKETTSIFGSSKNTENIKIENTIFSDIINDELKERGYVDTLNKVLKNKTNTLYLDADLNYLALTKITPIHYYGQGAFYRGEIGIKWTVKDIYKTEIFTFEDKVTTGEIATPFPKKDEEAILFNDAFAISLDNLLKSEDYIANSEVMKKAEELDKIEIAEPTNTIDKNIGQALAATVTIKTDEGHGSGFFINNEGYILTNHHVISRDEDYTVVLNNGEEFDAEIIQSNAFDDVAIIKIDHQNKLSYDIQNFKEGSIGDDIYAIGTPNAVELGQTLSKGIISGQRTNDNGQEYYQTDASVNRGNSGGAFVNSEGEILGIVNAKLVGIGVEGVGFAIKIGKIQEMLNIQFK
ncbi:hypothetical protein CW751_06260 [Brumimicrobium salinarum]|uniref:PEGA domain-containing protein n=1 Tax=Brumimicrobium salinarum TaxID=2058658 RepID=A0A2I0R3N2_9FLAO|nr:trypsin-like peptidase domain-containing protein [Brumimicrobium salinarum]PKR81185.1 hypothetical protein CW751_06260 [Brumimicrobium salinarum]